MFPFFHSYLIYSNCEDTMQRPGYDDYGCLEQAASLLQRVLNAALLYLSKEERAETVEWISNLVNTLDPYGLDAFNDIATKLTDEENSEGEEDEENVKSSAMNQIHDANLSCSSAVSGDEEEIAQTPAVNQV